MCVLISTTSNSLLFG